MLQIIKKKLPARYNTPSRYLKTGLYLTFIFKNLTCSV
nr:MAG TPA: hypothetical protein [Caudoviricetes sp.]